MTIIHTKCPACETVLHTSKGDREFKLSDHIEIAHPDLYDEMHGLAILLYRP